jgi:hypothetical protein
MYLTINFDGVTALEPVVDVYMDTLVERLYHATIDKRLVNGKPSGNSRTGRKMFQWLRQAGLEIIAAGSSDWVVFAQRGKYHDDEAYFLHFIIHTIQEELDGHPELKGLPFADWCDTRHAQVDRGELVYIAHQLDFLARFQE